MPSALQGISDQIGVRQGCRTTLMAPEALSPATRNASAACSRAKRWVITVCAMFGLSASIAAASSVSRTPWWQP
jgi:hypothetical protein